MTHTAGGNPLKLLAAFKLVTLFHCSCIKGCMKTSAEDKADCLNSVFAVQCSAPPSTGKPRVSSTSVDISESFSFTAIAQESVKKSLSKLNVWKAVGPDGIPNRVLKECAATLAEPLTFIFNWSLASGLFSIQWKQSVINLCSRTREHAAIQAVTDPSSCYRVFRKCLKVSFTSSYKSTA